MSRWWLLVAFFVMGTARAEAPPDADPALIEWFQAQHNKDGISCCGQGDGHLLDTNHWRAHGDGYQVLSGLGWIDVPPDNVVDLARNPTGEAVAFYIGDGSAIGTIFCFILPEMS